MNIDRMHHLFLTGEKQVGKSTLIRQFLEEQKLEAGGFLTLPFQVSGQVKGHVLHSLMPLPPFENDSPVVIRLGERNYAPVIPVFEATGVKILEESLAAPSLPLLVMDELGKAEREAKSFLGAVIRCLSGPKPVLGVLQKGGYPFFEKVAGHPDVHLFTVTEVNRAEAAAVIRDWARSEKLI